MNLQKYVIGSGAGLVYLEYGFAHELALLEQIDIVVDLLEVTLVKNRLDQSLACVLEHFFRILS